MAVEVAPAVGVEDPGVLAEGSGGGGEGFGVQETNMVSAPARSRLAFALGRGRYPETMEIVLVVFCLGMVMDIPPRHFLGFSLKVKWGLAGRVLCWHSACQVLLLRGPQTLSDGLASPALVAPSPYLPV